MKDLSEKEILSRLRKQREKFKLTHEEVISPEYEVWGRARGLYYHQIVCLLAGMTPVSKPYFNLLINQKSPLDFIKWHLYYPTEEQDRNRLKNIDQLLEKIEEICKAKKASQTVEPRTLIALCKQHQIAQHAPPELIEACEKLGPHPSLNLPSTFCSLEIDPSTLENLRKYNERKKARPIHHFPQESVPITPTALPVPTEPPLSVARRLFPLEQYEVWDKADTLSLSEIVILHYGIDPHLIFQAEAVKSCFTALTDFFPSQTNLNTAIQF